MHTASAISWSSPPTTLTLKVTEMEQAIQAETTDEQDTPSKVVKLSDEMAQLLESYHQIIERAAGVSLKKTKALEWCIRRAIETLKP